MVSLFRLPTTPSVATWVSHRGQGGFGTVVGEFSKEVTFPGKEPHARIAVTANGTNVEADINVHSTHNPDGTMGGSDVLYATRDELVPSMPADGETSGGTYSYKDQGWKPSDFKDVGVNTLHDLLIGDAEKSQKVEIMGMFYSHTGIHDVHMNSGETPNDPQGNDGVVRFYTTAPDGQIHRETVAIKFQDQRL